MLSALSPQIYCQNTSPSTEGKEFWVTFMKNGKRACTAVPNDNDKLQLTIIAREVTTATISNPTTGYTNTVVVPAMTRTLLEVPYSQFYTDEYGTIMNTGMLITAEKNICVYASNQAENSFDATLVLPIRCLGKDYSITTVGTRYYIDDCGDVYAAQFAIVATTDNTRIKITSKLDTNTGQFKDLPFEVTLNRGQVYMIGAEHPPSSSQFPEYTIGLSGSWVEVVQGGQVAVFQGNSATYEKERLNNPNYNLLASHTYDQAIPIKYCGKQASAIMVNNSSTEYYLTAIGFMIIHILPMLMGILTI